MGEYNVPYGKKNRGMTVVHSYRYLAGDKCCGEGVRRAMILGWCVEWVSHWLTYLITYLFNISQLGKSNSQITLKIVIILLLRVYNTIQCNRNTPITHNITFFTFCVFFVCTTCSGGSPMLVLYFLCAFDTLNKDCCCCTVVDYLVESEALYILFLSS